MTLPHKLAALPILVLLALPLSACQKHTDSAPEAGATDSQEVAPTTGPTDDTAAAHEEHNHPDDDHEHNGGPNHDHDHDHDTVAMTTYSCQPEQTIKVHYDTDSGSVNSTPRRAHLLIDDIEYELTPKLTTLAAGVDNTVVYETDIGINNDAGMYWQVNDDQASLVNKTLDVNSLDGVTLPENETMPENETILFTCNKTAG